MLHIKLVNESIAGLGVVDKSKPFFTSNILKIHIIGNMKL